MTAALQRPRDETQETSHRQIGGRARALGRVGGAAAVPTSATARTRNRSSSWTTTASKGGVDNLDKVIGTYSCRRMTARWPLVVFHNILDVSSYNSFVMWREIRPDWMLGKRNKWRVFLQELGRALVTPFIAQRERTPRTEASTAAALRQLYPGGARPKRPSSIAPAAAAPLRASKRKRCQMCPRKKDLKTQTVCSGCKKYICKGCSLVYCNMQRCVTVILKHKGGNTL